ARYSTPEARKSPPRTTKSGPPGVEGPLHARKPPAPSVRAGQRSIHDPAGGDHVVHVPPAALAEQVVVADAPAAAARMDDAAVARVDRRVVHRPAVAREGQDVARLELADVQRQRCPEAGLVARHTRDRHPLLREDVADEAGAVEALCRRVP